MQQPRHEAVALSPTTAAPTVIAPDDGPGLAGATANASLQLNGIQPISKLPKTMA